MPTGTLSGTSRFRSRTVIVNVRVDGSTGRRVCGGVGHPDDAFFRKAIAVRSGEHDVERVLVAYSPSSLGRDFELDLGGVHHLERQDRLATLNCSSGNDVHLGNLTAKRGVQNAVIEVALRIYQVGACLFDLGFNRSHFGGLGFFCGIQLRHVGLGTLQRRDVLIEFSLRDCVLVEQLLSVVKVSLGQDLICDGGSSLSRQYLIPLDLRGLLLPHQFRESCGSALNGRLAPLTVDPCELRTGFFLR